MPPEPANSPETLAGRIRSRREQAGLSMEQLAVKADVSKTYLWELEKDEAGEKKPSADILVRIADALSTTISDLLGRPSLTVDEMQVELSPSLVDFRDRMRDFGKELSGSDLVELAMTRFRGAQPSTFDDWLNLYLVLERASGKTKK